MGKQAPEQKQGHVLEKRDKWENELNDQERLVARLLAEGGTVASMAYDIGGYPDQVRYWIRRVRWAFGCMDTTLEEARGVLREFLESLPEGMP